MLAKLPNDPEMVNDVLCTGLDSSLEACDHTKIIYISLHIINIMYILHQTDKTKQRLLHEKVICRGPVTGMVRSILWLE